MRWASMGSRVEARTARTTSGPMVMLGTNRPSITSTWIMSAPPASTARTSSPRREKSAGRIDGAIRRGRGMARQLSASRSKSRGEVGEKNGRGPRLTADEHERVADRQAALLRLREHPARHHPGHASGQRRSAERRRVDLGVLDVARRTDLEADDRLARPLAAALAEAHETRPDAREVLLDDALGVLVAQPRGRHGRVAALGGRGVGGAARAAHVAHQTLAAIVLDVEDVDVLLRQRRPLLVELG